METAFHNLMETIRTLRLPGGCPWDIDQTPMSMRRDLLEECFEAIDAITENDAAHAKEELGDLLFNTLVMSYMYEQAGDFSVRDVLSAVNEKLVRRHPHVFKDSEGKSEMERAPVDAAEVLRNWEKIKENVEGRKGGSALDSIPAHFSVLLAAGKMLKKASKKKFGWSSAEEAKAKVREEWREVERAAEDADAAGKNRGGEPFTASSGSEALNAAQKRLEEEVGDLFLALVDYARRLGVEPEIALERANRKFSRRFRHVEKSMEENGIPMDEAHAGEMAAFWNEAKAFEPRGASR